MDAHAKRKSTHTGVENEAAERAALDRLLSFYAPGNTWLPTNLSNDQTIDAVDEALNDIDTRLDGECGAIGRDFRHTDKYTALKTRLRDTRVAKPTRKNKSAHNVAGKDVSERAAMCRVRCHYAPGHPWLDRELSASEALAEIESAEFEVNETLANSCGALGREFKRSPEYKAGKASIRELRGEYISMLPATALRVADSSTVDSDDDDDSSTADSDAVSSTAAQFVVHSTAAPVTDDDGLGHHSELLEIISDEMLAVERNFRVLIAGVRGESVNSGDEPLWKAAGQCMYDRYVNLPDVEPLEEFDGLWTNCYDRRFDARVIGHYARLSNSADFLDICRRVVFSNDQRSRTLYTEAELCNYFVMAFGDNLLRIQKSKSGIRVWFRKRWRCDASCSILSHCVLQATHAAYKDLLAHHKQNLSGAPDGDDDDSVAERKRLDKLVKKTARSYSMFGNQNNKNVVALIQNHQAAYALEIDPFDEDRYLFSFTDSVYDFRTGAFRPHFKFDYALQTCGREWREPTDVQVETVRTLVQSIQPDADSYLFLLSLLRSGLTGVRPEMFVILTGGGRNGKGVVLELMQFLMADYAQQGHIAILTKPPKSGPNTELRELHKKRMIQWSEPEEDASEPLRLSNIKALTGGEAQNGRGLFDSDSDTRIFATCLMDCNAFPAIVGNKGVCAKERMEVLDFPVTFIDDAQKVRDDPAKYGLKDTKYKSTEFKEAHYCAFFKLLTSDPVIKDVPIDKICPTDKSRARAGAYLDANDFMPSWITENYTKLKPPAVALPPNTHQAFVGMRQLYNEFKASSCYETLNKAEKRAHTEAKFRDAVTTSSVYKSMYRAASKIRVPGLFAGNGYNTRDGIVDIVPIDAQGFCADSCDIDDSRSSPADNGPAVNDDANGR